MLSMAKKKPNPEPKKQEADRHLSPQIPFRPDDPRLVDALNRYADQIRRSRNMAIVLLLEEALEEKGLWPPKEESNED